jgi:hypothetical protein
MTLPGRMSSQTSADDTLLAKRGVMFRGKSRVPPVRVVLGRLAREAANLAGTLTTASKCRLKTLWLTLKRNNILLAF